MRKTLILLFFIFFFSVTYAQEHVVDEQLFNDIRKKYNSSWPGLASEESLLFVLQDDSVLIEINLSLAEYFLYNLKDAKERIQYIPSVRNGNNLSTWPNYFERSSDNLVCRLNSQDLKNDPFPTFKCRFRIDKSGNLHPFELDVIPNFDPEPGLLFSKPIAYSQGHFERSHSFTFLASGQMALYMFKKLRVEEQDSSNRYWPIKLKIGNQIWCYKQVTDVVDYKCGISFNYDGIAFQDFHENDI